MAIKLLLTILALACSIKYQSGTHKESKIPYTYFPAESENLIIVLGSEEYSATSLIFSIGPMLISNSVISENAHSWIDLGSLLFIDTGCGYTNNMVDADGIVDFLNHNTQYYTNKKVFITALGSGTEFALSLAEKLTKAKIANLKGVMLGGPVLEYMTDVKARPVYAYANDIIDTDNRNYITSLYKLCTVGIKKGTNKYIRTICTLADKEALGKKAYENYVEGIVRNIGSKVIPESYVDIFNNKGDYNKCDYPESIYGQANGNDLITLTEAGIKALLYYGDKDFFTTWYGGYETISKIWSENSDLEESKSMKLKGKQFCSLRVKNNITFAKIADSAHYPDVDNSYYLHALVKDWLKKI